MEAFSLLKYWRSAGAGSTGVSVAGDTTSAKLSTATAIATTTTTIVTAVSHHLSESDEENNADDGPFFDLEFTLDDGDEQVKSEDNDDIIGAEENDKEKDDCTDSDESDGENERELKFTLSSASSGDSIDPNVSLSPSDDLFFKGRLVPLSEPNCKPVSLLKSATKSTKFGVMMLKLKKSSKSNAPEKAQSDESASENPKLERKQTNKQQSKPQGKFFTVKFKVEEVPIVSLFTRDYSSKGVNNKAQKQNIEKSVQDERGFSKDVMQKYLKKVKPLYVRVSKRYGEKLGFSGQLSLSGAIKAGQEPPQSTTFIKSLPVEKSATESPKVSETQRQRNVKNEKRGSLPGGRLHVVRKHLGKGRSATVAAAASPPEPVASKRRDDSLLQQQDGIQGAIMHCKRSFKASRDLEASGELGSVGDESQEKSRCESGN